MLSVALVVAATLLGTLTADALPSTLDDPAQSNTPAVRGPRRQVDPLPPPPTYGGCLIGSVGLVNATIDPQRRWWVGTVSSNWKSALYPVAGARGPVAVVGDSLTLSTIEETMRHLVDAGFGPICIDGGVARRMTVGATSAVSSAEVVIGRIKTSDPVWQLAVVRWVLGIGTNDARPNNVATWPATIAAGRAAVGTGRYPLYWIDIRTRRDELEPGWRALEDAWNSQLLSAGLAVISWSAAVAPSPSTYIIASPDWIHLRPAGDELRGLITAAALAAG